MLPDRSSVDQRGRVVQRDAQQPRALRRPLLGHGVHAGVRRRVQPQRDGLSDSADESFRRSNDAARARGCSRKDSACTRNAAPRVVGSYGLAGDSIETQGGCFLAAGCCDCRGDDRERQCDGGNERASKHDDLQSGGRTTSHLIGWSFSAICLRLLLTS